MKVVLDTQVLEDAELRAITKYRTAGKSRRKATRAEAKQFLQQVIDEAVTVTLAGPPPMIPTVGSAGPGPDDELDDGRMDMIKANISAGEEWLAAKTVASLTNAIPVPEHDRWRRPDGG